MECCDGFYKDPTGDANCSLKEQKINYPVTKIINHEIFNPTMEASKDLTGYYYTKIVKSLKYFEYTHARVLKLSTNPNDLSEQELETWDGFATRFSRTADIFLSKYIKAAVQKDDPGFDGSFRDYLNRAEKLKLIEDTGLWLEIRSLRNVIVHDYSDSDLDLIFKKMLKLSPLILGLRTRLTT